MSDSEVHDYNPMGSSITALNLTEGKNFCRFSEFEDDQLVPFSSFSPDPEQPPMTTLQKSLTGRDILTHLLANINPVYLCFPSIIVLYQQITCDFGEIISDYGSYHFCAC